MTQPANMGIYDALKELLGRENPEFDDLTGMDQLKELVSGSAAETNSGSISITIYHGAPGKMEIESEPEGVAKVQKPSKDKDDSTKNEDSGKSEAVSGQTGAAAVSKGGSDYQVLA